MLKYGIFLPRTAVKGEVVRFTSLDAEAFEGDVEQNIYEYLQELGIEEEAEHIAKYASEWYPWRACDIVVWEE